MAPRDDMWLDELQRRLLDGLGPPDDTLEAAPAPSGLPPLPDSPTKTVRRVRTEDSPITLGADLEGELVRGGEVVPAHVFYPADALGKMVGTVGYVGCDGCSHTLELRPKPSESPEQLVANINAIISHVYNRDGFSIEVSGAREHAVGAHIHFGGENFREMHENGDMRGLVEVLDDFLGKRLLPLSGRARGPYKGLGLSRTQPHGFEYRTLPACIIANPRICGIVFELAGKLAREITTGDMTYEVDGDMKAARAEYVRRLGPEKADFLFDFVDRYKPAKGVVAMDWPDVTPKPKAIAPGELEFEGDAIDPKAKAAIAGIYASMGVRRAVRIEVLANVKKGSDSYDIETNREELTGFPVEYANVSLGDGFSAQDDDKVVLRITPTLLRRLWEGERRPRRLVQIASDLFYRLNVVTNDQQEAAKLNEGRPEQERDILPGLYPGAREYAAAVAGAVEPGDRVAIAVPWMNYDEKAEIGAVGTVTHRDGHTLCVVLDRPGTGKVRGIDGRTAWRNAVVGDASDFVLLGQMRTPPPAAITKPDTQETGRRVSLIGRDEFGNGDYAFPYEEYVKTLVSPGMAVPVRDKAGRDALLYSADNGHAFVIYAKRHDGVRAASPLLWPDHVEFDAENALRSAALNVHDLEVMGPPQAYDVADGPNEALRQAKTDAHEDCCAKNILSGTVVRRGPDWHWDKQDCDDDGNRCLGRVIDEYDDDETGRGWVRVQWTNGKSNIYRMGKYSDSDGNVDVAFDLDIVEVPGKRKPTSVPCSDPSSKTPSFSLSPGD